MTNVNHIFCLTKTYGFLGIVLLKLLYIYLTRAHTFEIGISGIMAANALDTALPCHHALSLLPSRQCLFQLHNKKFFSFNARTHRLVHKQVRRLQCMRTEKLLPWGACSLANWKQHLHALNHKTFSQLTFVFLKPKMHFQFLPGVWKHKNCDRPFFSQNYIKGWYNWNSKK